MLSWFKRLFMTPRIIEPCLPSVRMLVANVNGEFAPYSPDYWMHVGFGPELADALYVIGRKLADELNAKPSSYPPSRLVHAVLPPLGDKGVSGSNSGPMRL